MLATMAAQALMHCSASRRRVVGVGGVLEEPLGDVRDGDTLRALAVDLRMAHYHQAVAAKMAQWKQVGSDVVVAKARCADLGRYEQMFTGTSSHAHALDKPTFWGLWRAAKADRERNNREKVLVFLSKANKEFALKHA
jgi:hypothetical protein